MSSSDDRLRAFRAAMEAGGAPASDAGLEAHTTLDALIDGARAAHPTLPIDDLAFCQHLAVHAAAAEPWTATLPSLHGADMLLAFACATGVPGAVARFREQCGPAIARALSAMRLSATEMEDVAQLLEEKLFVAAGERPRILGYAGRGPLAAWVAISARRTAMSLHRVEGRERARRRAAARAHLVERVDPELAHLKARYRTEFAEAVDAAFAALTDRQRTLLRLHLLDRLKLDQIAIMFHVDASTISRWIFAAREEILSRTRAFLGCRLRLSPSELTSIVRLVRSQVDLSLARLLERGGKDE